MKFKLKSEISQEDKVITLKESDGAVYVEVVGQYVAWFSNNRLSLCSESVFGSRGIRK